MTDRGRPTRADYAAWRTATTRWADDDVYGHMNNAAYFEIIDTAVNAHLVEAGVDVRSLPEIGIVAEVSCRYFEEMGFPAPVDVGLVVERLGTSSIVYRIGMFQGGRPDGGADEQEANAEGRFVHVYVDNTVTGGRRPVVPIPSEVRGVAERLTRG